MSTKILNRWTSAVLWESPCSTMREAVIEAVSKRANLRAADLRGADLGGADLRAADLGAADLGGANLGGANLGGANLGAANLRGADLRGVNLRGANLRGANNTELAIAMTRILPEGELIVWKKARSINGDVIVKLRIPKTAKRSHAFGRKCRASRAVVLQIIGAKEAWSGYDSDFKYKVGSILKPRQPFCEDFTQECASGIHFMITRLEAENYSL